MVGQAASIASVLISAAGKCLNLLQRLDFQRALLLADHQSGNLSSKRERAGYDLVGASTTTRHCQFLKQHLQAAQPPTIVASSMRVKLERLGYESRRPEQALPVRASQQISASCQCNL